MKTNSEDSIKLTNQLINNGYGIIEFANTKYIHQIQALTEHVLHCLPIEFHQIQMTDEERLKKIKQTKDAIINANLVKLLFADNLDQFNFILGSDIDIQSDIHLRISRPKLESDLISWHRDTFYGNSLWELNCWFPIFELEKNSGLTVIAGSHLQKSENIRYIEDDNLFRSSVTKGSIANELGFVYATKTDDSIEAIKPSSIKLLTPAVGQAIVFFGHMIHRAQNHSDKTRISIDVRLKNMFAPTNTKPGYYQPLARGCVAQYVEKMQKNEVLYGN